jgi:hypothetical protein
MNMTMTGKCYISGCEWMSDFHDRFIHGHRSLERARLATEPRPAFRNTAIACIDRK